MNITTPEQVENMKYSALAQMNLKFLTITENNFWMIREQARSHLPNYKSISLFGDDPMRFLHVSTNDPNRVAYTKNAEKGKQDIQTVTTLEAYCDKFGLDFPQPTLSQEHTGHEENQLRKTITHYFDTLHTLESIKKELKAML